MTFDFCPCLPQSVTSSVLALPRFCPYLEPDLTRQSCRRSTTIPLSYIVSLISSQSFLFFLIPPFLSPLSRALSLFLCLSEWRPQLASAYGNVWRPADPADIRFRPSERNAARSGKKTLVCFSCRKSVTYIRSILFHFIWSFLMIIYFFLLG